jgi:hypothetical protein
MASAADLLAAVARVAAAMREHAEAAAEGESPPVVVRKGASLNAAVLEYEKLLGDVTGWSAPIRHLGKLPAFEDSGPDRSDPDGSGWEVVATYRLRTRADDDLCRFVSARYGEETHEPAAALKTLYEADGWDPLQYWPGLLDVVTAEVTVAPMSEQIRG